MTGMFGPRNEGERLVFAIEELLADVQLTIQEVMAIRGISRSELARRLGCSPSNVTQMLSEDANLKLETIARVFHALGDGCDFQSRAVKERREQAAMKQRREGASASSGWAISVREDSRRREAARGVRHLATPDLLMAIARQAAKVRPLQPQNNSVLPHKIAA